MAVRYTENGVYIRLGPNASEPLQRAPLLEKWMMRASAPVTTKDWRADAFRVIAGNGVAMPSVAAAALLSPPAIALPSVAPNAAPWACMASPVHLVAGMNSVTLSQDGILNLEPAEAWELAADFNRVFDDSGARMMVCNVSALVCVFERVVRVTTREPDEVTDSDVWSSQPVGEDAARFRKLMSEMELWLFEHTVNRNRLLRSRLVITGFWLWGGGPVLQTLPIVHGWTAGPDPLFSAFGDAPAFPLAGTGAGVLVCRDMPGSADWSESERRWLAPAFAALRAGRIEFLTLSFADRWVTLSAHRNWRFWRKPRPWWEVFERESNGLH